MAVNLTTPNTLLGTFQPKSDAAKLAMGLVTVVLGTALLTIAAKINVPVWPVHITMQSLVVAALAAAFGARIGVATVMLYLVEGLSGLPVFSSGGGFGYIMSPSFGFIVGWLPMAYIIGRAADRGAAQRPLTMFAVMFAADAVSFAFGFAWLLTVANLITQGGGALPAWLSGGNLFAVAFDGAVKPFIVWDLLKMAFAALTVTGAWSLFGAKR